MKTQLQNCNICKEETYHDIRKTQSGERSGKHYTKRIVMRCRGCGTKEINHRMKGRRIIKVQDGKTN